MVDQVMQGRLKLCAAQGQQEYHNCEVIFLFPSLCLQYILLNLLFKLLTGGFHCSALTRHTHFLISYLAMDGRL